jgi:hypothetical protein
VARFLADDFRQQGDSLVELAGLHLLAGERHLAIERGVARARPQQPQALLGIAAHEATFVAQALMQKAGIAHGAKIGNPHHAFGAGCRVGTGERLKRFGA